MQSACRAAHRNRLRAAEMAIGTTDAHPLISQIEFPYAFGVPIPKLSGYQSDPYRRRRPARRRPGGLPARLRQAAPMMKDDLNPRSPPRRSGNPTRATCCTASPSSGSRRSSSRSPTTRCSCSTRTATSRPGTRGRAHQGLSRRGDRRPPLLALLSARRDRGRPAVARLAEAAANGHFEDEGWRVRKDGSQFWANVTITPVHDHSNQLCGFIKITRDMTERKRLEAKRRRTGSACSSQCSRTSCATISRRCATRSACCRAWPTRPRARAVPRRRASSGHATDAARRRPARRRAHHRRQARAERPADYRARHRVPRRRKHPAEAGRARQHIHVDLPADAVPLHGDDARLVQVLHNLLDNASKFSPLGGRIDVGATIEGRSSRSA